MDIAKGKIGNALTSTAADHVVAVASDIYDEEQEQYQAKLNADTATRLGELAGYQFMHNDDFMFAITDSEGYILIGIRYDGSVYQPKGMPEEVKERLSELSGLQMMENERYVFAIVDSEENVLFGIERNAHIVMQNGLTLDGWKSGLHMMNDQNYLLAIVDKDDRLLFGIGHDGKVTFDKGVPKEVQVRLDELSGYKVMNDENFIFAIVDKDDRLLFGIEHDGHICTPKGTVEVMSWEEYQTIGQPHKNTLYAIQNADGSIGGAYLNGTPLAAGEEYAFMREDNVLYYHGKMSVLPKIWIDHDTLELMVDYPSDYSGPRFSVEDGMLFIG